MPFLTIPPYAFSCAVQGQVANLNQLVDGSLWLETSKGKATWRRLQLTTDPSFKIRGKTTGWFLYSCGFLVLNHMTVTRTDFKP